MQPPAGLSHSSLRRNALRDRGIRVMQMLLKGQAIAVLDGARCDVEVTFDLKRGACSISRKAHSSGIDDSFGLNVAFSKQAFLEDVRLQSPLGLLRADAVGPFCPSYERVTPSEDKHVASSALAKLLTTESATSEIDEISLIPRSSGIRLEFDRRPEGDYSEALFYCDCRRTIDCAIDLDGGRVRVHSFELGSPLAGYIRCTSPDVNLGERLNDLRLALSLFFRRRSFVHLARDGAAIWINLTPRDSVLAYGVLIKNPTKTKDVLQKLIDYVPRTRPHFLIEAFSNPGAIEVRLLNAFVHLEIVDRGKKLSANQLVSLFGISRENADVIVQVRNAMIHDGVHIHQALERARLHSSRRGRIKQAGILERITKSDSPHGEFYSALMDLLSTHLALEADIPPEWVARRTVASFYER